MGNKLGSYRTRPPKLTEPPAKETRSLELDPETARIIRLYLERVACRVERTAAGASYMSAFKIAAQLIREQKPD